MAITFAPIVGSIFTAIAIVVLLLPLQAGLRTFVPQSTQRTQAIITACVLLALVSAFSLLLSPSSLPHARLSFRALWSIYIVALVGSFFWPCDGSVQTPSAHDRTA
jgi:hypothetical protein